MPNDLTTIGRRLRALTEAPAQAPYDWTEFQRRRQRSRLARVIERNRPVAIAAGAVAALLVTAAPFILSPGDRAPAVAPKDVAAGGIVSHREEHARTRDIEGWLTELPRDHAIVRVGAHAAVSSLQDEIAALDDLISAERAAGAPRGRVDALERQRAQLVSSLAQVQYAEMLASATR